MKTKNIFKALVLAAVLVSACSKNDIADDFKGYTLPVTINVTRQGDEPATRATYNESTKKLEFSAGDKLFVSGSATGAGSFAGALDYDAVSGKFSGTIYTKNDYDGTADALFSAASSVRANLLPNGYDSYNFLYINNKNTDVLYDDVVGATISNAFVASETAKKTGVEQLSWEQAYTYSSGFALAPANAVLNFTISGLEAGEKAVTLYTQYSGMDFDQTMSGSVTPNASGVATFAIGVPNNLVIKNVANNLTIGSSNFTLPGNTVLAAGKIYNITRAAAPAPDPLTIEAITAGTIVVKSPQNGMQYSLDGGATKVTMTGYTTTNIPVEAGQKVRFYGNGTSITAYGNGHDTSFGGSGDGFTCKVYGNIMSLLDETGYATATTLSSDYVFWGLFSGNTALTDASGLLLPATTLTQFCYQVMFSGCSSLTAAPELPATTLVQGCYQRMFKGCASLTSVKCLATSGINTNQSTYSWLGGVSATGTFTKAASATWPTPSSSGIPSGWTVVNAE